jgi:Transposase DDE domain
MGEAGKQDFVYLPTEDVYRCPAGQKLSYHYTNEEDGKTLRRYWTTACPGCPLKSQCTKAPERRIRALHFRHVLPKLGDDAPDTIDPPLAGDLSCRAACNRSEESQRDSRSRRR